jgi:hypothetical protein
VRGKLFAALALLPLAGCAFLGGVAEREKVYGNATPVITESFASPIVKMGENWLLYIKASDPDGDMDRIVCFIDFQDGAGPPYPTGITKIREDQIRNLSGYFYLDTSGQYGPMQIILTLQIRDKAGHYSAPLSFALSIVEPSSKENRQEEPPAGIFQEENLGPIMISLTSEIGYFKNPGAFDERM